MALALTGAIHPGAVYAQATAQPSKASDVAFWEELAFWETIKESRNPAEFKAYLKAYPEGRFARLAEIRIRALTKDSKGTAQPAGKAAEPPEDKAPSDADASSSGRDDAEAGDKRAASSKQFRDCDVCPLLVEIPAGTYQMGSDEHRPEERPRHEVALKGPFAIAVYETTVGEWRACESAGACRYSPPADKDERLPVSNVSWDDAKSYTDWLTAQTGKEYRLPSEAEWEYAAGAGSKTQFWWGNEAGSGLANCEDCGGAKAGEGATPVGSFKANPFGLYDVHGNLWEWTADCANRSYKGAPADGSAWLDGDCVARMLRGGSWKLESDYMRTTRRYSYDRDVRYYFHGFRVARPLP